MMPKRRTLTVFDESDTSTGVDVKRQKKYSGTPTFFGGNGIVGA